MYAPYVHVSIDQQHARNPHIPRRGRRSRRRAGSDQQGVSHSPPLPPSFSLPLALAFSLFPPSALSLSFLISLALSLPLTLSIWLSIWFSLSLLLFLSLSLFLSHSHFLCLLCFPSLSLCLSYCIFLSLSLFLSLLLFHSPSCSLYLALSLALALSLPFFLSLSLALFLALFLSRFLSLSLSLRVRAKRTQCSLCWLRSTRYKFSKVIFLLNLPYKTTIKLIFENCKQQGRNSQNSALKGFHKVNSVESLLLRICVREKLLCSTAFSYGK